MTLRIPLAAIAACLLTGTPPTLRAEPTAKELFDGLPKQVQAEVDAKRAGKLPQGVGQSDPNYLLSFYRNAREYLENADEVNAIQQLRQMEAGAATEPMRASCEAVVAKIRQEHADHDAVASAEVAGVLQRAGAAILSAKTPKDLDTTLRELAALAEKRAPGRAYERGNDTAVIRLQSATRFVARWQDYLLAQSRDETRQATDVLKSLLSETESFQPLGIPRSEVIGRVPPVPTGAETPGYGSSRRTVSTAEVNAAIEAALNRLKTLDDLPVVIHDLTAFRDEVLNGSSNYGNNTGDFTTTLNALQSLQQCYLELQNGLNRLPLAWFNRYDGQGIPRGESRLVVLRAQLIALSLPHVLGAPDSEKPGAGEHVDAFLDRLLAAAKKRGDWEAVARGVEARRLLASGLLSEGGRSDSGDESAFREFFAGQNFEQAGQYVQAVSAYLSALGTGSQDIPVALISERLAAIKKDHSMEYTSGDQAVLPNSAMEDNLVRRFRRADSFQASTASAPNPSPTATPTPSPTPAPTPATATPVSPKPAS